MRHQVLDGGSVDNRNTGFRSFEREWTEPGPLTPAHYAHLHAYSFRAGSF